MARSPSLAGLWSFDGGYLATAIALEQSTRFAVAKVAAAVDPLPPMSLC